MAQKHQKASDIFRESNFPFIKKGGFKEAFPQIESLSVEVCENGKGIDDWNKESTYNIENFPGEFIDCNNPRCYGGGFSICAIIRKMAKNKETSFEGTKYCKGNEGSPKGRKIYRKCWNSFNVKVSITYVDSNKKQEKREKDI